MCIANSNSSTCNNSFFTGRTHCANSIVYTVNAGGNEDGVYVRSFGP